MNERFVMTRSKTLYVGGNSRELGPERVIEAMFTTVSCRLEPHGRGTRFPAVMDDLYSGYLTPARAPAALHELQLIEDGLRKIPVSDVVWSLMDLRRGDDANEAVNHHAGNAFEYFVDVDGRPLMSRLADAVQECLTTAKVLRLAVPGEGRIGLMYGLVVAALGFGWMFLGRALIPGWSLKTLTGTGSIPIWTFGMDLVMAGAAIMTAMGFPSVYDWFRRRSWALISVAIIAVIGWLVVCARAGFLPD
jgi:2,3-bisphosphoglycerate-dependent phosphoglycerate mutase